MARRPDLDQLRILVTVARRGSISAASDVLLRSQSAVSVQLRQLEEDLGYRLFHRHARGVTLTREGELAVGYANRILGLVHELMRDLGGETFSGLIRMGIIEDFTVGRLPRLLREFAERREMIEMQVVVGSSTTLREYLRTGRIDLALAATEMMSTPPMVRWSAPLLWVASRDFRVDTERPLPLILLGEEQDPWSKGLHPWYHRTSELLEEHGLRWRIVYSTSTVSSLLAAVEAGLGIALIVQESFRPTFRVLSELDGLPPPLTVEFGLFSAERPLTPGIGHLAHLLTTALLGEAPSGG